MKSFLLAIILLATGTTASAATFSDYAVTPMQIRHLPRLAGKSYATFRTRANELLQSYVKGKEKALAGHVIFTPIGCGTECVSLLGINLLTGEVRLLDLPAFRYDFRADSRLLIVNRGGERGVAMNYPEQQFVVDENMQLRAVR